MKQMLGAKQPYEEYYISFDFTRWVGEDTILTATAGAVDNETGEDVTDSVIAVESQAITGPVVSVWVKAGQTGATYKITCRITVSDGSKYELDAFLPVLEV